MAYKADKRCNVLKMRPAFYLKEITCRPVVAQHIDIVIVCGTEFYFDQSMRLQLKCIFFVAVHIEKYYLYYIN